MAIIKHPNCLLVALFLVVFGVARGADCPNYWVAFEGSCYLFAHDHNVTFHDGESFCQTKGGHLVHVNDAEENTFLENTLKTFKTETFWMGLTDELKEGEWRWTDDNTTAEFFDWGYKEPYGQTGENCAHFYIHKSYHWNDARCDGMYMPVCEINPFLLLGSAFGYFYVLLILEKQAVNGGRERGDSFFPSE